MDELTAVEFVSAGPNSAKMMCAVCGATGWETRDWPNPRGWMHKHLTWGHSPCPKCGKPIVNLANGAPRTHGKCPKRERVAA